MGGFLLLYVIFCFAFLWWFVGTVICTQPLTIIFPEYTVTLPTFKKKTMCRTDIWDSSDTLQNLWHKPSPVTYGIAHARLMSYQYAPVRFCMAHKPLKKISQFQLLVILWRSTGISLWFITHGFPRVSHMFVPPVPKDEERSQQVHNICGLLRGGRTKRPRQVSSQRYSFLARAIYIWGWVKTLVPSEPQVIAGIYGCE